MTDLEALEGFISRQNALTRRQLIQGAGAVALTSCLLPLAGCPTVLSQSELVQLVAEVGVGLQAILPHLTQVSPALAAKVEAAFTALETAVQQWKPGAAISLVEQAVNDFVANMTLIPVLAPYQPLVAIIVATAEGILALLLPTPSGTALGYVAAPKNVAVRKSSGHIYVDVTFEGASARLTVKDPPTTAAGFKKAWSQRVKADAQLAGLAIQ